MTTEVFHIGKTPVTYRVFSGIRTSHVDFYLYQYENGNIYDVRYFCFTYNEYGEFIGYGSEIPSNSNSSKFVIKNILSYYFNSNDILIQCIDTDGNKHWIKPIHAKSQLYFNEVTRMDNFKLQNYKHVIISN